MVFFLILFMQNKIKKKIMKGRDFGGRGGIIDSSSFLGCPLYCFLINGDHFCLFQNTIFRIDSRVLMRMFEYQGLTKSENKF